MVFRQVGLSAKFNGGFSNNINFCSSLRLSFCGKNPAFGNTKTLAVILRRHTYELPT
jgi:hypothetical protein